MEDIERVLADIATGEHRPHYARDGITVYVVIDDHGTTGQPQVSRRHVDERTLARSGTHDLVDSTLEYLLHSGFAAWRRRYVERLDSGGEA